jgi:putative acetyltransferase
MPNHFKIRKGELNDLRELQKLFVDTITTICAAHYNSQQIEAWTSSVKNTERWNEMIAKQYVIVAHSENKIVGFATLDNCNYFDFLYVHKDHQRQGIAQQLLNDIEAEARRLKQTLLTAEVSTTAKSFFEKNGYKTQQEQTNLLQGVEIINYNMTKQVGG